MLFNSYEFILVFLPLSFVVYFFLNKRHLTMAAKLWLVVISLVFYGWWNIKYVPLILVSILVNYTLSALLIAEDVSRQKHVSRKAVLKFGLVFNIGLLGYFKYMDFFVSNLNAVVGTHFPLLRIILPLGISFFTITQIAYLVDAYEGLVTERNLANYALFVVFFPHLLAGPILHHSEMMPQFDRLRNKTLNYRNISLGLFTFAVGLFKKVIIADTFAIWVTRGFDQAQTLNLIEAWVTSLSYTFQLYFDFSGYTDMAIGSALLFNIRLPQNFNSPYKATGIIDFWKRWHMTLTGFITTYIYTVMVKSFRKLTFHKAMLATLITFLIAGLWHGASWMFVIFGGLNGLGIVLNHYWQQKMKMKCGNFWGWVLTFNFVNLTFIFFRSRDLTSAAKVLHGMLGLDGVVLPGFLGSKMAYLGRYGIHFGRFLDSIKGNIFTLMCVPLALVLVLAGDRFHADPGDPRFSEKWVVGISALFAAAVLSLNKVSEFIYFNF